MPKYLIPFYAFGVDVFRLAIWLIILVAIFIPLERLFALHPQKILRKQFGVDLVWYFVNTLFPATVVSVPLAAAAELLQLLNPGGFYSFAGSIPFWVRLPLMLLASDIGAYWGHRLMHSRALWKFHAVHHSAEEMDWLVNTRAHPFDIVVIRLAGLAPIYLLGLAAPSGRTIDWNVALVVIIATFWNFFIHANVRFRLGFLESVFSSPIFHHWHHCNDRHRHTNFAFIFPFIDRIFGTAWMPGYWPPGYGVDEKVPKTVVGQFLEPVEAVSESELSDR